MDVSIMIMQVLLQGLIENFKGFPMQHSILTETNTKI